MKEFVPFKSVYGINEESEDRNALEFIIGELTEGFNIFDKSGKFISVFGSARIKESDSEYSYACEIGAAAAEAGFSVITGGGPGIMEAAAKGAFLKGGVTYGINVKLPHEQGMNPYIRVPFFCRYLFTRKILLMRNSCGFVIMPGGFGTMDELFEILTLIATTVAKPVPVIFAGSGYWNGLYEWIKNGMISKNFITEKELEIMTVLERPEDIVAALVNFRP